MGAGSLWARPATSLIQKHNAGLQAFTGPRRSSVDGHRITDGGTDATRNLYPKASPRVFGLAAGVGVSRVHLVHHFPSDVVVGSWIGIATGTLVAWLVRVPKL